MKGTDMKIRFSPHAFANFNGTQEELDEFVKELQELAENGNLLENSVPVDMDDLEENDPELAELLKQALTEMENDISKNKLN